jgi:hypothetical protein
MQCMHIGRASAAIVTPCAVTLTNETHDALPMELPGGHELDIAIAKGTVGIRMTQHTQPRIQIRMHIFLRLDLP